jgi:hypothetical protein
MPYNVDVVVVGAMLLEGSRFDEFGSATFNITFKHFGDADFMGILFMRF